MRSKKNFAKLMKSSLSSSKKRKLDEAELESADEPDYTAKDKELKALRTIIAAQETKIAEKDSKIADLQKQLDWAMNTAGLHEKMAKISDEIAEIRNAQTQLESNVIPKDELGSVLGGNAEYVDLEGRVQRLEGNAETLHGLQGNVESMDVKVMHCEDAFKIHNVQIQGLAAQVEKLKQGQLDKLLGKTIKDFMQ